MVEKDHFHVFRPVGGKYQFCTKAQQPVLVEDDQPLNLATDASIEQPLETPRVRVYARPYVRDGLKRSALAGTEQLKHLFLPFQLVLLIGAGNTGIGNGTPVSFGFGTE
ncbi:conserved protein of unknown function [Candidatus Methylacidiphilum fumarolicum]|uniref:Uncharacterized protein n=1 Tax=Candidatus Methylacidiphilum fumarolicum TaxID=591154 RepID=A0ABM9IEN5_9BACT|nr:conserved protein of unknown function [Candidatus Methylacidiphilum fumarolicum]